MLFCILFNFMPRYFQIIDNKLTRAKIRAVITLIHSKHSESVFRITITMCVNSCISRLEVVSLNR